MKVPRVSVHDPNWYNGLRSMLGVTHAEVHVPPERIKERLNNALDVVMARSKKVLRNAVTKKLAGMNLRHYPTLGSPVLVVPADDRLLVRAKDPEGRALRCTLFSNWAMRSVTTIGMLDVFFWGFTKCGRLILVQFYYQTSSGSPLNSVRLFDRASELIAVVDALGLEAPLTRVNRGTWPTGLWLLHDLELLLGEYLRRSPAKRFWIVRHLQAIRTEIALANIMCQPVQTVGES